MELLNVTVDFPVEPHNSAWVACNNLWFSEPKAIISVCLGFDAGSCSPSIQSSVGWESACLPAVIKILNIRVIWFCDKIDQCCISKSRWTMYALKKHFEILVFAFYTFKLHKMQINYFFYFQNQGLF